MNSVDHLTSYQDRIIYHSPKFERKKLACTTYDFPEGPPQAKKDKKWSLGSLFRRKKKDEVSDTSSEEDTKKNFLSRRKKKPDKKRKKIAGAFDHIVLTNHRKSHNTNGYCYEDTGGVLSDPSGGFTSYPMRPLPRLPLNDINVSLRRTEPISRNSMGSADSLTKRKKDRTKLRAEARRETLGNSSSDDDSQRSLSSARIRSDENLFPRREGSFSKRSRGARTERYIRRLSKDEENILNREAKVEQEKLKSKSDAERNYRRWKVVDEHYKSSPSPIFSQTPRTKVSPLPLPVEATHHGLSMIPPNHYPNAKSRDRHSKTIAVVPPASMTNTANFTNHRSLSYESNINKQNQEIVQRRPQNRYRNLSLVEQPRLVVFEKQPPPPPPRDPKRMIQHSESLGSRPLSNYFTDTNQSSYRHIPKADVNKSNSLNWHPGYRSSDDFRPTSITPEIATSHKIQRQQQNKQKQDENYQYLTDKQPRSRKPILIQSQEKLANADELSKNALNFWKQKEQEEVSRSQEKLSRKSLSYSPQMFTAQTHVRTNIFLPSVTRSDVDSTNAETAGVDVVDAARDPSPFKPISPTTTNSTSSLESKLKSYSTSPFDPSTGKTSNKHSSSERSNQLRVSDANNSSPGQFSGRYEKYEVKAQSKSPVKESDKTPPAVSTVNDGRKSSNLEEALDELEAIYQSLHLGDEDLLERAEQRETSMAKQKLLEKNESYPGWVMSRGAMSDSSFSYEPFDAVDYPRKKRMMKKNRVVDRKNDDMAYRKLHKERSNTINDPQSVISNVSYLLASPVHFSQDEDVEREENSKEPDITLDDVVYRNIKHANNTLKVSEPQPFGIPMGPISAASNSDYLHAVPENSPRYHFKSKKIPDIVKDDLAFRNLRKDSNKAPSLPSNQDELDATFNAMKKKRAVRSLSANIGNLIQRNGSKQPNGRPKGDVRYENEFYKPDLDDIADAMEIAREILRNQDRKTRRGFLSDTDAKYNNVVAQHKDLNEVKMNLLNGLKDASPEDSDSMQQKLQVYIPLMGDGYLESKPPRGLTPDRKVRETTPVPAPRRNAQENHSSLEELLTALEVEAKETTERINNELKEISAKKEKDSKATEAHQDTSNDVSLSIDTKRDEEILQSALTNAGEDSEHAKLCEKLLGCVLESPQLLAASTTEVIDEEKAESLDDVATESKVNVVLTPNEKSSSPPLPVEVHSEPDYENFQSEAEAELIRAVSEEPEPQACKSPFEEHKADLIAGFQELNMMEDVTRTSTSPDENDKEVAEVLENCKQEPGEGEHSVECALPALAFVLPATSTCHSNSMHGINTTSKTNQNTTISNNQVKNTIRHMESQVDITRKYTNQIESVKSNNVHQLRSMFERDAIKQNMPDLLKISFNTHSSVTPSTNHSPPEVLLVQSIDEINNQFDEVSQLIEYTNSIPTTNSNNKLPQDVLVTSSKSMGRESPDSNISSSSRRDSISCHSSERADSEISSGFHSERSLREVEDICKQTLINAEESYSKVTYEYDMTSGTLKSPKLVLKSAHKLEEFRKSQENLLLTCKLETNENSRSNTPFENDDDYDSRAGLNVENMFSSQVETDFFENDHTKHKAVTVTSNASSDNSDSSSDQCRFLVEEFQAQCFLEEDVFEDSSSVDYYSRTNSEFLEEDVDSESEYFDCASNVPKVDLTACKANQCDKNRNKESSKMDTPSVWYRDPILLAIACTYGLACTYQMASLDAVTILGLIFVILSFLTAVIDFF